MILLSFSSPKKNRGFVSWLPLIIAVTFLLFVSCVAGRFANQATAERALQANGFSSIKLAKRSSVFAAWQGCDKTDLTVFTFTATNAIGKTVTVNVCQGWPLKGATIRSL
jgi:hypothetical protein